MNFQENYYLENYKIHVFKSNPLPRGSIGQNLKK